MTRRKKMFFVIGPLAMTAMLALLAVAAEVVHLLWNAVLPPIFGWRLIGFWQALGLLVLCRLLFGGFGAHRSVRSSIRRKMEERMALLERLTPEERERFRQGMRGSCGFGPKPGESPGQ